MGTRAWDAVVIGAGVGGLVAGGLLARSGRKVLLLEAHDKPGGSAGFYEAGGFTFDAGATTLVGLEPGGPFAEVVSALGIEPGRDLALEPVDGVDVRLPGASFVYGRDREAWRETVEALFPRAAGFFGRVERDAARLWETGRRFPALPLVSPRDLGRNVRLLHPRLLALLPSLDRTVADVERLEAAPADDPAFRSFVDLSLLITVQAPAAVAPWWNGALGLDLFRRGVSRPRGGMRAFVSALEGALRRSGAEVRYRTLVARLERRGDGWRVTTASGEEIAARVVVPNVPVLDLVRLLSDGSPERAAGVAESRRVGEGWGALVWNLGLSRVVHPDPRRLHRLVLPEEGARAGSGGGSSLFLSFSPPGDPVAPPGGQTLSVSLHTSLAAWRGLSGDAYRERKDEALRRIRSAVEREVPGLARAIACEDLGTPRTFRRFTRRGASGVGGLRMSVGNSGFRALDPTFGVPGLHLVGDTTFPGQGTLAVALSGALAAERLGAVRLRRDGRISFAASPRRA